MRVGAILCGLALVLALPALAIDDNPTRVARLALDVQREQDIRAVKRITDSFAQYEQFGLWDDVAALFAGDAELIYGDTHIQGAAAIGNFYQSNIGGGHAGLAPGDLHTEMLLEPLVNLAADGQSAKGRWHSLLMRGSLGHDAEWRGGIQENDYVKENGVWKIKTLHYYPMLAGAYETGWHNVTPQLDIVPYHHTPAEAGVPIPPPPPGLVTAKDSMADAALHLVALDGETARLNDEDKVRNLQNSYGYYVDRKMWDDVTDLFTADGVLEIGGQGLWNGVKGIRRELERDGPAGLKRGQMNDHMQVNMVVQVAPDGMSARARGFELGTLGDVAKAQGFWTIAVFQNSYAKGRDGIWRIREMRLFPLLKTDYYKGWAKSQLSDAAPGGVHKPDAATPAADIAGKTEVAMPAFLSPNPVSGKPVQAGTGSRAVAANDLHPAPKAQPTKPTPPNFGMVNMDLRLNEAQRKLAMSVGYDAVENLSSAFGNYIDDSQWQLSSALFAQGGARQKTQVGFYLGPDRIYKAETDQLGPPRPGRASGQLHLRIQPVIDVTPDGRSAWLRTRLFHPATNAKTGSVSDGMYPSDSAVLEDGVWKLENVAIDEPYYSSTGWEGGWAKVPPPGTEPAGHIPLTAINKLIKDVPPDVPLTVMGTRERGLTQETVITWPEIKPMWFHYKNPVSGRIPPLYCPDEGTCY